MKNKNLLKWVVVGAILAFTPIAMAITTQEIYILNNQMGPAAKKVALGTLINAAGSGGVLARGNIFRGNAAGAAAAYDSNDSGKILVGDGTDLVSVAVSGDVTLSSAGAVAIAADTVINADVKSDAAIDFTKLAALSRGFVLRGNATNVVTAYDANDSGKILVGDGTDLTSVAVSGDATLASSGALTLAASSVNSSKIADDAIVNADVKTDAAIAFTKLATLARGSILSGQTAAGVVTALDANDSGKILVGDGTDVASVAVSGDVTLASTGAVAIVADTIIDADVKTDAAIAFTKLASLARGSILSGQTAAGVVTALNAKTSGNILVGDGTDVASVAVSGDVTLASTGAVAIAADTIIDADVKTDAAIAFSKLAGLTRGFVLRGSATGVVEAYDANNSGQILVGDGTDVASVAVSGDATLSSAGAVTIANAAVSEVKMAAQTTDGLHARRVAVAHYDFATDGGVQGAINLGAVIPTGAAIEKCYLNIITGMTSAGGTGTIRIGSEDLDDDILASVDADTISGFVATIPTGAVATFIKTTAARQLKLTIGVEDLTAGKFAIVCDYTVVGT